MREAEPETAVANVLEYVAAWNAGRGPAAERAERGAWVGCIAGALSRGEYEAGLTAAGYLPPASRWSGGCGPTPRVPWQAKAAVVLAGLWVLSPIDLLPEFLPIIGPPPRPPSQPNPRPQAMSQAGSDEQLDPVPAATSDGA